MNSLVITFALLLAIGMPATGLTNVQSNNSTIVGNNLTDSLLRNATSIIDDATSIIDDSTSIINDGSDDETSGTDSPFLDEGSLTSGVVLNEVERNPRGDDPGNEWIEIYNLSYDDDAAISRFEITTSFKTVTLKLPPDTVI